jgi:hypothetical protein
MLERKGLGLLDATGENGKVNAADTIEMDDKDKR